MQKPGPTRAFEIKRLVVDPIFPDFKSMIEEEPYFHFRWQKLRVQNKRVTVIPSILVFNFKWALMSSQPHRLVPLANGMTQLAMTLTLLMIAVILPMLAQLR